MSSKAEAREYRFDIIKWLLVVLVVAAGIIANSYYADTSLVIRAPSLVVGALVALFIAANTAKGAAFWDLIKEAFVEIRKVVWPTTQETNQTTLIVFVVVLITGLILWGLDSALGSLARLILG